MAAQIPPPREANLTVRCRECRREASATAATIPATMPAFTAVHTPEQRDAAASAFVDRGIAPARRIRELAKAGELAPGLEPFDMPESTIRSEARKLRQRRAGKVKSKVAQQPDAVQALRISLLAMCDQEIEFENRKRPGTRDPERIRQIARALREAAALPTEPARTTRPGDKTPGTQDREAGATEGGLAGSILAAARAGTTRTRGDAPQAASHSTQPRATQHANGTAHQHTAEHPGS